MEPNGFQIPIKRLQKPVILRGRNMIENMAEYNDIIQHKNETRVKRKWCSIPESEDFQLVQSCKNVKAAKKILTSTITANNKRQHLLQLAVDDLQRSKENLTNEISRIEESCLQNLRSRENDKLDALSKIKNYVKSVKEIKKEKEKHDILIRIGLIMESLVEELKPYEDILGHLSLQGNSFKSKAETLEIKKNNLMSRRDTLNAKLRKNATEYNKFRYDLFNTNFKLGEETRQKVKLVNKFIDLEARSMGRVLDLEYKLAQVRSRSAEVEAENAWFYWFLDWVLFDVIGTDTLAGGINASFSPQDKTQCIIQYYNNLKVTLADRNFNNQDINVLS